MKIFSFFLSPTVGGLTLGLVVLLGVASSLPEWVLNQFLFAFSRTLAVLGLLLLWRGGLVSFGHALYFGLGGYSVALVGHFWGVTDVGLRLLVALGVTGVVGGLLGIIVCRYRQIFFAMLNLAFSMVLYGILVKTESLGSTDGFSVSPPTFFGEVLAGKLWLFYVLCGVAYCVAVGLHGYLLSTLGFLTSAVRDNEVRVEYLGFSVNGVVYLNYVISAVLAGLGGGFMALALGQVDPDSMVNWTASGELVFVTILSGAGHVAAPFVGSLVFELLRTYAFEWFPQAWQLLVGGTLLLIIVFLPQGLWSLVDRRVR